MSVKFKLLLFYVVHEVAESARCLGKCFYSEQLGVGSRIEFIETYVTEFIGINPMISIDWKSP